MTVRAATDGDLAAVGRLLDRFNREYDEPTPGPAALAGRVRDLIADEGLAVLLAAPPDQVDPVGLAVVRLRPALWTNGLEAYLAELYVVPEWRGRGHGRALIVAVLGLARSRGADRIEVGTAEDDRTARVLYESVGFTNREGGSADRPGSLMYVYERDL